MKKFVAVIGALCVSLALLVGSAGAEDVRVRPTQSVAVAGTPAVGSAVEVVPAPWATTPDTRAYEWLRDGEGDVLSHDTSYTLTQADLGHTLVVVERVWFGGQQDETSSVPVSAVAAGPATTPPAQAPPAAAPPVVVMPTVNTGRPSVKGTVRVGKTLKVRSKGAWTPRPSAYSYQWLRNGKKISKATKTSYKLTKKDRKKKITVRVTAKRAGTTAVAATSKASKRVR